jgi:periplasmic protein TonB
MQEQNLVGNQTAAEFRQRSNKPSVSANFSAVMLENNRMKRPKGAVDIVVSLGGHVLVVVIAILLPLYFSDAIHLQQMETTYLVAPPLPPPPPPTSTAVARAIRRPNTFLKDNKLYAPPVIPKHIAVVKDLANAPQTIAGVPGGVVGGVPGGQLDGVIGGILGSMGRPTPPPEPVAHRGPYLVGGRVQAPRLIQQVQPVYPVLAREAKMHGDVVIDTIIDGRGEVTQMKLVSGSPLLAEAAFNAVGQWKYEPTLLDGTPVAIEMEVTVHFNLGS